MLLVTHARRNKVETAISKVAIKLPEKVIPDQGGHN